MWLKGLSDEGDVAISEFSLVELYGLLRNPAVHAQPLSADGAAAICGHFRRHPRWRLLGFSPDSAGLHDALWREAGRPNFPLRRIYDARLALSLRQHAVSEFATANVKDFQTFGFSRVWNPLVVEPAAAPTD